MYRISVTRTFSSAHSLRNYKGKCERIHGHNWTVRLTVSGRKIGPDGMLFDFTELKALLDKALAKLDHGNLNEIPPFDKINPSAENIAKYICGKIESLGELKRKKIKVYRVSVWESEKSRADYLP